MSFRDFPESFRKLSDRFRRRPASTEGHTETARETGVALGLMAQAADAAEPTPEQQIFLSQAEHGMRERLSRLLDIPHRSLAQEREKLAIEGWLTRSSSEVGAKSERSQGEVTSPSRIQGFLGPLMAANPLAGILMSPALWVAAAFAIPAAGAAVQTFRLHHAKSDLTQARHDLAAAVANAHGWEERAEQYRHGLIDAANVAHQAAAALDAERAAQARAAARERRRNRDLANVLANSPEAPSWELGAPSERVRDNQPSTDQPAAPAG